MHLVFRKHEFWRKVLRKSNDDSQYYNIGEDYIYEYKARDYSHGTFNRLHIPDKELISLDDYRTRYSQYKLDPDIIAAHSSHPFIVIWDDHETSNNTYMTGAQNHQSLLEGDFYKRKIVSQFYYCSVETSISKKCI